MGSEPPVAFARAAGPVVFLDRDGVLNELVADPAAGAAESPLRVADVALVQGAARAAGRLADAGFRLACVTNQPAAAKGTVSLRQLLAVHARVLELLDEQGVLLAGCRLCLHHPAGVVSGLAGHCDCRKPAPGMLLDLAAELGADLQASWMVGDTDADIAAGRAAGCRTLLIRHPASAHKRRGAARPDLCAASLAEGVGALIAAPPAQLETPPRERATGDPAKPPQIDRSGGH
ncbi:MAG TPA: HAD-IIIA family hydrolase [Solirubrobacteraceae bacterium]|nr:HAD-IIIA family hydrolase [Solirubrobacteraceae bacterium]